MYQLSQYAYMELLLKLLLQMMDLKEKLGRPPGITDLEKYTTVSVNIYKNKWGQWSIFKKEMGDPTSKHFPSKKQFKKEFIDYIEKHGSLPKHKEWTKHGLPAQQYICKEFGCMKNFYDYIGIKDKAIFREKNFNVKKGQLTKDYFKVKKIVNKKPTLPDLLKHIDDYNFITWVNKYYGNYSNFLKSIDDEKMIKEKSLDYVRTYLDKMKK